MNTIIFMGRLTADPELATSQTGKYVTNFTVAVPRTAEATDFIQCQAWDKQADNLCKYKTKGDQIAVVGSLRVERYKNKEGYDRTKTYVLVRQIDFIYAPKPQTEQPAPAPAPAQPVQQTFATAPAKAEPKFDPVPDDDDSLPF